MILIDKLNFLLKKTGAEFVRFPNAEQKKRKAIFNHFKINKVFDIGANVGQYAEAIREVGYTGEIISFEPIKNIFQILEQKACGDDNWNCENYALGDSDEETAINIAGNAAAASSSMLEMLPAHLESAPTSGYTGTEKISVKRLDAVFSNFYTKNDNIYVKIDAQGFEKNILDGALNSMNDIKFFQVEMSLIPLYKDSLDYLEMIDFLTAKGYDLYGVEPGFFDQKTGRLMQFDGLFVKK